MVSVVPLYGYYLLPFIVGYRVVQVKTLVPGQVGFPIQTVTNHLCPDLPNGLFHQHPRANTIVPGSPTKKIPIRLIGYETTISLIGSDLG